MEIKKVKCGVCGNDVKVTKVWTCIEGTEDKITVLSSLNTVRICKECWKKLSLPAE